MHRPEINMKVQTNICLRYTTNTSLNKEDKMKNIARHKIIREISSEDFAK